MADPQSIASAAQSSFGFFSSQHWIDFFIIVVVLLSAIISLFRGFVKEAMSLVAWALAFYVAITFPDKVSPFFQPYMKNHSLLMIASFLTLFVGTLIVMAFVNHFITKIADFGWIKPVDKLLGVVFGVARGVLVVALLLLGARLTPIVKDKAWHSSMLIPHFQEVEDWLQTVLEKHMPGVFPDGNQLKIPELPQHVDLP